MTRRQAAREIGARMLEKLRMWAVVTIKNSCLVLGRHPEQEELTRAGHGECDLSGPGPTLGLVL